MAGGASLRDIGADQNYQGDQQNGACDSTCRRIVIFFKADHDEQRGYLGLEWHVASNEDHRTEFTKRTGKRKGCARDEAGPNLRKYHMAEDLPILRAKRAGSLFRVGLEALQYGLTERF